jgi:hypothetical protein
MPDYQKADVERFLTVHPPPFTAAQFNNSGKVGPPRPCPPILFSNPPFYRPAVIPICPPTGMSHLPCNILPVLKARHRANYVIGVSGPRCCNNALL